MNLGAFLLVEALMSTDVDDSTDVERPAWMRDALCREHPEVSFFPARGQSLEPAKQVCRRCLVLDECLADALEQPDWADHGIWGGTSVRERQQLRRGTSMAEDMPEAA